MAARLTVLASGSKGNCSIVSSSSTSILVDAGLSAKETLRRMALAGEDPGQIRAIVITHEHSDHVSGLAVLARKLAVPVFMTEATHHDWHKWSRRTQFKDRPELAQVERLERFHAGHRFHIGDISVQPFTIPHDAADPVGFVFTVEGVRVGVCTDLGYLPSNVRHALRGCDGLLIESNHDLEMLRNGPYPWAVKQRVMSRVGHLSNEELGRFLETDYDGGAAFLVLAHLSENNNLPDLARATAERALAPRRSLLHANRLAIARQQEPLEPIWL
jgi:phosphoribosyl 1,2-cyclic phosphodiesterase